MARAGAQRGAGGDASLSPHRRVGGGRVAVMVPNWLGDSVMAMPALQTFCRRQRIGQVTIVAKARVLPLWQMHPNAGLCVELGADAAAVWTAARRLARERVAVCYVLPNSMRAALVPLLARVPERIGQRGHRPPGLLTTVCAAPAGPEHVHQAWESMVVFGNPLSDALEPVRLNIPGAAVGPCVQHFGLQGREELPLMAVAPGAAYGPSKRWPAAHFVAAARGLVEATGCRVAVIGARAEAALGAEVAAGIGPAAVNLAGATSIPELAALLERCRVVVCNDSGAMHLAAAVGTPVVAVYGLTDPFKTGPLGENHRLVMTADVARGRDLARDSATARQVLAEIAPERVIAEALDVWRGGPRS